MARSALISRAECRASPHTALSFRLRDDDRKLASKQTARSISRTCSPGEYGLKIGSDTLRDRAVPMGAWDKEQPLEERLPVYDRPNEPWRRALRVSFGEGKAIEGRSARFEP